VSFDGADPGAEPVVELYRALLSAWNARDAAGFAATLDQDAIVIGFDGSQMLGAGEVAATLGKIFADHETAGYVARVRRVRPLAPDVVLLHAVVGMVPPGGSDINPERNAVQILVARRTKGRWLITNFQNTPAAFHGRPELARDLTQELRQVLKSAAAAPAG
jgi:uncharacterized protein (TIGR02246 family)